MIRRPIQEDDENPDRWLVSYADFITLLFAFFVVMYAVSTFKQIQHDELSQALNKAFSNKAKQVDQSTAPNIPATANTPALPADIKKQVLENERENMTRLGKTLAKQLSALIHQQKARVMQNASGLHIIILDDALFADGSPDLTEAGQATITALSTPLRNSQHAILVEGHTDNTPIHIKNAAFFSNWELSAVRASSIIGTFSNNGLQKSRLSALGYGPSQPISSNTTLQGQTINRHMSILVLYDSISLGHEQQIEIKPEMMPPIESASTLANSG